MYTCIRRVRAWVVSYSNVCKKNQQKQNNTPPTTHSPRCIPADDKTHDSLVRIPRIWSIVRDGLWKRYRVTALGPKQRRIQAEVNNPTPVSHEPVGVVMYYPIEYERNKYWIHFNSPSPASPGDFWIFTTGPQGRVYCSYSTNHVIDTYANSSDRFEIRHHTVSQSIRHVN